MTPRIRSALRAPALVGVIVALVAAVVLTATHRPSRPPLSPRTAIRAALHDRQVRATLKGTHWTRVTAGALDRASERVSFFAGARVVGEVALDRHGAVIQIKNYSRQPVPYGDWIAYQPALLIALSAVFALMTAVVPLRRLRNLDVAAALSLVVSVVVLEQRYVAASVIAALPGLGYLLARAAWLACAPAPAPAPATPLLHALTPGWDAVRRVRLLRATLLVLVLIFVMVGVSSPIPVDVVYAAMEGATALLHGVLPYGHLPGDVVHGDTYPLLTYVLYVPVAWLEPVQSVWDSVDLALAATVAGAATTAWMLHRAVARPHRRGGARRSVLADEHGLRMALAWLTFPPVLIAVSSGTTDVVLAGLLLAGVLLWNRPALAAGLLTAAGWFKLAPFLLIPIVLASLRGRRLAGAAGGVVAVSLPLLILLLALGGGHGPGDMVRAISFQFSRGSDQSLWSALGLTALQPVGEACVLGLVAGVAITFWRQPVMAADPARFAAAAAACLIAVQLSADYWAFLYVVWVVPLLCLSAYGHRTAAVSRVALPAPASAGALQGALGR